MNRNPVENDTTLQIRIPTHLKEAVQEMAEEEGVPVSDYVRQALVSRINASRQKAWAEGRATNVSGMHPFVAGAQEAMFDKRDRERRYNAESSKNLTAMAAALARDSGMPVGDQWKPEEAAKLLSRAVDEAMGVGRVYPVPLGGPDPSRKVVGVWPSSMDPKWIRLKLVRSVQLARDSHHDWLRHRDRRYKVIRDESMLDARYWRRRLEQEVSNSDSVY